MSAPTIVLRAAEAQARYVHDVVQLLKQARLSRQYPPVAALSSHLEALSPRVHGGVYSELRIHPGSGLPTLREWSRVRADRAVAQDVLAGASDDAADSRLRYHQWLLTRELAGLDALHLEVCRLDRDAPRADLRVSFDKLDRQGCFVRFVIELSMHAPDVVASLATDAGRGNLAERLKRTVYPYAEADAEWALIHLDHAAEVRAQRVERGTVGPLFVGSLRPGTVPGLDGVVLRERDLLGTFGLDAAGVDVADDRDDDPLARLVVDRLSPEARPVYLESRRKLGYHVFKGRKFVASRDLVPRLRGALQELGTRNVIYALNEAAP